jgi:RNA polymerase sigma factor (sigma-70 family)
MRVTRSVYRFFKAEARREANEYLSDRRHRSKKDIERPDIDQFIPTKPVPFEDRIADKSEVAYVHRLLDALTETQRRRVRMYFFDRLTYQQIADYELVDESAVRNSVKQAIGKLKNICKR